jgi:protein-S-isoprenylcysteine O-methyltransferase Ste14
LRATFAKVTLAPLPKDIMPADATRPLRDFSRTKLYDVLAAAPLLVWFVLGIWKLAPQAASDARTALVAPFNPGALLDLLSSLLTLVFFTLVIALVFARRMPVAKSSGLWPRLVAIIGGNLEVALGTLHPVALPLALKLLSTALIAVGTGAEIVVLIWLGRAYSIFPEARRLVLQGPYRWIRHPLYLTAAIATIGIAMGYAQPWAALLAIVTFGFQIGRMHNEEHVLAATFPEYAAYAARTKRLIPGIY